MTPKRWQRTLIIVATAAALVGAVVPARASTVVRREQYRWHLNGQELDVADFTAFGIFGCKQKADCITLLVHDGEHSMTLNATTAGVPVYGFYETYNAATPPWPNPWNKTDFCGRTTFPVEPGEHVTVYFTVIQDPARHPGVCAQSAAGKLTVAYWA